MSCELTMKFLEKRDDGNNKTSDSLSLSFTEPGISIDFWNRPQTREQKSMTWDNLFKRRLRRREAKILSRIERAFETGWRMRRFDPITKPGEKDDESVCLPTKVKFLSDEREGELEAGREKGPPACPDSHLSHLRSKSYWLQNNGSCHRRHGLTTKDGLSKGISWCCGPLSF